MSPSTRKSSSFYKRLAQSYAKINTDESKTKQLAQIDYIWSRVQSDVKKIKIVLLLLHNESKILSRVNKERADFSSHNQLKKYDAELYQHLWDDGVIHQNLPRVTEKPDTTIGNAYKSGNRLGSGRYGNVYNGTKISDGRPVAVKIVEKTKITDWKSYNGLDVPMEAYLNLQLGSESVDGVAKILNYYLVDNKCVFVFEKPAECMDLFDYINMKIRLSEGVARHFMIQIIDTVIECTSLGVLHGDINDKNIVIDIIRNQVKLIDFGSGSTVQDEKYTAFSGSRVNAPPEVISEGWYHGEALTVWTLGALLFDMVTGDIPFHDDVQTLAGEIKFNSEVSNHCQHLIKWCLSQAHTDRPTLSQIQQHPWIHLPY